MENMSFGTYLRNTRLLKGISQEKLSAECGLNVSYMCRIETNKFLPSLRALRKICSVLALDYSTVVSHFYVSQESDSSTGDLSLGTILKNARILKGFTQHELADTCEISRIDIVFYEKDNRRPMPFTLIKMCSALDLDYSTLITRFYSVKQIDDSTADLPLGAFLKNSRLLKGLTQQELADLSGVNTMTIHYAESGKKVPMLTTLELICSALELDFDTVKNSYNSVLSVR